MSTQQLADFLATLKDDVELRERLQSVAGLDNIVSIARDAGFDVSQDDLTRFHSGGIQELTDSDLEGISGGTMCTSNTNGCEGWTIPFSIITILDGGC